MIVFLSGADGALAGGLRGAGAVVAGLGGVSGLATLDGARQAFDAAARAVGEPDAVVHAAVDPVALEAVPVADLDDARFDAVWEQAMRATLFVLQAAHPHLAGRGGSIVVVTPTIGLSGAPNLAAYAAAVEGQRLLAKSAARQWGADGITVNCVAPSAVAVGVDPEAVGPMVLSPPALGAVDVAAVVDLLLTPAARNVTGATVWADGGSWMAP